MHINWILHQKVLKCFSTAHMEYYQQLTLIHFIKSSLWQYLPDAAHRFSGLPEIKLESNEVLRTTLPGPGNDRSRKTHSLGVPVMAQRLTNLTGIHGVAGSIPGLAQWVKDPLLPWAVVWVTDSAWIPHCCGSGVGQCLQLWFNP